ncbi:hypothetical protein ONE63_005026 [Megalurothrips usitatus]|uniref:Uncharacterized protein n=1 Tax=Megalurothrips usitatus TaxID=439358 RepID=A0AAV7X419_9NEOP|nr:hypothetical protein ONE63_005026 [Megalurothrips usitatus]
MRIFLSALFVVLVVGGSQAGGPGGFKDVSDKVSPPLIFRNASYLAKSTHNINKIVDVLLAVARVEVSAQGLDQVALSDFEETFRKKIGPIRVTGHFNGYNGWAKTLSTLQRKGDATATTSGLSLAIDVPIGFGDLQFGYRYKAKISKIRVGGHADATVGSNALRLRASVSISSGACSAAVDSLELTDLGKIKVKATGLGALNFLLDKVADWMAKRMHSKIEDAVQKGLRKAINKAGLHFSCDEL